MAVSSHLYCAGCGGANPMHARYCRYCGQMLQADEGELTIMRGRGTSCVLVEHDSLLKQRYRLLKQIGSGGFGAVYTAEDTQFGNRRVAIKILSERGLDPQETLAATEAFKREAFMLAGLTHPNLPGIFDYFIEQGRCCLVMSFIAGETLEEYLQRAPAGRLAPEKVLNIGIQLAAVLSYLHVQKPAIVFRDLKPTNIMRISDGQLYLIDFGIARLFKPGQSKDTMVLGSPGYAAPEQYGRAQTTPQTDVYSLGAVLYQLLTGDDPALSPFSHPPLHLPRHPELGNLVMCMLEHDARKRPASMANISRELQRIMTGRSRGSHPRPSRSSSHSKGTQSPTSSSIRYLP